MEPVHFLVPGRLPQRTGGFLYDARIAREVEALGIPVHVRELRGSFPGPDPRGASSLERTLSGLPEGARAVVDGLAMGAHPEPVEANRSRLRIVGLVHHPLADEPGLSAERSHELAELEGRSLRVCRGVVVTSPFTARRLDRFGVPSHRVRVVRPGTDPAPRSPGPEPGRPPRILAVGAVVPRKGYDLLVEALGRLRGLGWECVIAGSLERDPEHAGELRRRLSEAGLEDRVQLAGDCDAATVERLYASSSLLVLPTRYEGYGMGLTEAMARGLPVVAARAGAVPETLPEGVGLLVPPEDSEALAESLRRMLEVGRAGRDRLGSVARRRARELPTWEESGRSFARAVDELAALAPREPSSAARASGGDG